MSRCLQDRAIPRGEASSGISVGWVKRVSQGCASAPRMVTGELSRVAVLVGDMSAQQAAHAVHKRERKAFKSRKRPWAPFAKMQSKPPPPQTNKTLSASGTLGRPQSTFRRGAGEGGL